MPTTSSPSGRAARRGITLVAIIVTLMVVVVIAAVAIPYFRESDDQLAAVRTAQILRTLRMNLINSTAATGQNGFCTVLAVCPKRLSHLTRQITVADHKCATGAGGVAVVYTATQVGNWTSGSPPFSGLPIVEGYGLWTPLGVIHDSLVDPVPNSAGTTTEIHMDSLSANQADYLDIAVDGVAGAGAGVLLYGNTVVNTSGQVLKAVRYIITNARVRC